MNLFGIERTRLQVALDDLDAALDTLAIENAFERMLELFLQTRDVLSGLASEADRHWLDDQCRRISARHGLFIAEYWPALVAHPTGPLA